jgi:hypothetical protein
MAAAGSVKLLSAMFSTWVSLSLVVAIMRRDWGVGNAGVVVLILSSFVPIVETCGWAAEYNVKYSKHLLNGIEGNIIFFGHETDIRELKIRDAVASTTWFEFQLKNKDKQFNYCNKCLKIF